MKPCILSADDDREIINTQRNIMKKYGFEIRSTTRLRDMKTKLEANEIDCIHADILFTPNASETDWDKPNGLSELKNILQGRTDIPVMVISGYIDKKARIKAEEYGISNAIYKWYSKPVDYEKIALDTIKAINKTKASQMRREIVDYIGNLDDNNTHILKNAFSTLPTVGHYIPLRPSYLLNHLEDLSDKILVNFKKADLDQFKELVVDNMCEYFKGNHLILAEYFRDMILQVNDENIMTEIAVRLIQDIIKTFRNEKLIHKDVHNARIKMEEIFKTNIKLRIKVDKYLSHI